MSVTEAKYLRMLASDSKLNVQRTQEVVTTNEQSFESSKESDPLLSVIADWISRRLSPVDLELCNREKYQKIYFQWQLQDCTLGRSIVLQNKYNVKLENIFIFCIPFSVEKMNTWRT